MAAGPGEFSRSHCAAAGEEVFSIAPGSIIRSGDIRRFANGTTSRRSDRSGVCCDSGGPGLANESRWQTPPSNRSNHGAQSACTATPCRLDERTSGTAEYLRRLLGHGADRYLATRAVGELAWQRMNVPCRNLVGSFASIALHGRRRARPLKTSWKSVNKSWRKSMLLMRHSGRERREDAQVARALRRPPCVAAAGVRRRRRAWLRAGRLRPS